MSKEQLPGRVVVTGATAGIGRALARQLAETGYPLLLIARRESRLRELANQLSSEFKVSVLWNVLDVQDLGAIERWGQENAEALADVRVLINNAGLARGTDLLQDGKWADWNAMIDTNIKGLLAMTRTVLPILIAAKQGHVVNLGSVAGRTVYPGGGVYCATKFAVRALSEGLRMDLLGKGIRVTNIEPGMVETEFSQVRFGGDSERAAAVYKGLQPLTDQDIAETIKWCLERPAHVNIQELLIMPTNQASVRDVHRN